MNFSQETSQFWSYQFPSPEKGTQKEEIILHISLTFSTISITVFLKELVTCIFSVLLRIIFIGPTPGLWSQNLWRQSSRICFLSQVLNLLCLSLNFQLLPGYAYLNVFSSHSPNISQTTSSTSHLQFCHLTVIPGVISFCVPSFLTYWIFLPSTGKDGDEQDRYGSCLQGL